MAVTIDPTRIARVYSGKPGCGCGCRGKYWPDDDRGVPTANDLRQIARVVKVMNARFDEVKYTRSSLGEEIFSLEDDQRYYWAYVKAAQ